jgi:CheY-like chemotaxis protein
MPDKKKILCIDDDVDMRALLETALGRFGFYTMLANDGPAGLRVYRENPDIATIILDEMMPGMSGMEVLAEIRKDANPPPVIILTARATREDVVAAIKAGVSDYLTKPVHLGNLVLRINTLIEQHTRKHGDAPVEKSPALGFDVKLPFTIVDVSETGCCFESSFAIPDGSIVVLESAEISKRLGLPAEYILPVRVANTKAAGKRYRIGAQFVGMDEEVCLKLRSVCRSAAGFRLK